MGFWDGLLGNASQVDAKELEGDQPGQLENNPRQQGVRPQLE
ncbi:MAG: hypothetical protein OEL66_02695 [Desulfobulbaceae bacterium]|nr:hypothetical protein [Desulfobulbaceae bacterium]